MDDLTKTDMAQKLGIVLASGNRFREVSEDEVNQQLLWFFTTTFSVIRCLADEYYLVFSDGTVVDDETFVGKKQLDEKLSSWVLCFYSICGREVLNEDVSELIENDERKEFAIILAKVIMVGIVTVGIIDHSEVVIMSGMETERRMANEVDMLDKEVERINGMMEKKMGRDNDG